MRAAIAADMNILKQLPADSPAAARLEGVINLRLSTYLGGPPLRPVRAVAFLVVLVCGAVWMGIELEYSVASSDFAVYGAGVGFFAAMFVQTGWSTLRVVQRYRRATVAEATASVGSEAPAIPSEAELAPE
jgi:hypothetical protein